jgi:3-hydroxy acid dehydrogenase/malonic semialdehyde reductase
MSETVFITGATSGFGESCAKLFAKKGWRLVLAARRTNRLIKLQEDLSNKTSVYIIALDVRNREAVQAELVNIPEAFQNIDVLINNAGLALGLEPAYEANLDEWETMVDTNIKGLMYCTRSLLPGMVERNRGHIINIGSVAGNWAYPGGNVYGATKAFVKVFSQNLRSDLLGAQVRVTNIEPGLAQSEFSTVRFRGDVKKAAQVYAGTEPLTPDDIANIIYWVVSLPTHVNINSIEVMPTCQTWGPFAIHRKQ